MIQAKTVATTEELQQILLLQQQNLRGVNNAATEQEQGFVTVTHTLEILQQMHQLAPGIIVKDGNTLAGFALVMLKECNELVPELFSMYAGLNKLQYKGKPLSKYHFYVMGQVCVAAAYRGKGVFDMLYHKHKEVFQHQYDFVLTEIATRNTRSMRAHERVGFKTIAVYRDELDEWAVVVWDFRIPSPRPRSA